jgi:hypothetical protein
MGQEMGIKGEGFIDSHSFHQDESGTINKTEGLIRKGLGNSPGGLQINLIYG